MRLENSIVTGRLVETGYDQEFANFCLIPDLSSRPAFSRFGRRGSVDTTSAGRDVKKTTNLAR
ncbi:unnamed protein product [Protopolystoma xenopodis]|uniref:Uncharacterized protein n=1 Tax=Protopolystoma xenopodis TaxID=117903 RepID=A0A448WZH2_9PLAT|nr:unnamed protein product [Protopolystoma xenopodis]